MVNKAILIGRLGKDPEVRYTPDGKMVVTFSLATDESFVKDGQKVTKTEWHRIVVWEKLAEICSNYLTKGSLIYIEGKIQSRQWEDKDGIKRTQVEIVARNMRMLETRKKEDSGYDAGSDNTPKEDMPF